MPEEQRGPRTWRELLNSLDAEEKRRIITALGIQEKTLDRWISGKTELPRISRIQQLFAILPAKTRRLFIESVQQDPDFSRYAAELPLLTARTTIPTMFYARILEANVFTPDHLRFATISQLILLQMVGQLDAYDPGVYASILLCTPPSRGNVVRTLSQRFGLGTPPWSTVIRQRSFFLGAESVTGQAAMTCAPFIIQDVCNTSDPGVRSVHFDEHVMSTAAFPIQRDRRIAGALAIGSAQANFFAPSIVSLIQHYSHLLVIALHDNEFYEQLQLQWVPSISEQQVYLTHFRERVADLIKQAHQGGTAKNWLEAEQEVRQQIESELLEGGA